MSDIFIHVYLDEDVDILVSSLLCSRGFNATTAQQAGQLGKTDAEQLEYATNQEAAILTHNRTDFEDLAREYFNTGKRHSGIIVAVRRSYTEIVQRLLKIMDTTTADEMSVALCHQIRVLDKTQLIKKLGLLQKSTITVLETTILFTLGFSTG